MLRHKDEMPQSAAHSSLPSLLPSLPILCLQLCIMQSFNCIISLVAQMGKFSVCMFLYTLYGSELPPPGKTLNHCPQGSRKETTHCYSSGLCEISKRIGD